ncbi:MAG TPA: cytochrome c oxidase subunit I [Pyrinomonadaceae bacterium]|nr:cytochrome c oxidase subunit I [Pyrinomonadaceae bacterium]
MPRREEKERRKRVRPNERRPDDRALIGETRDASTLPPQPPPPDAGAPLADAVLAEELVDERERAALAETWSDPPGFWGQIASVNHKTVGMRFIVTAFGFFILGGILAVLMRIQLARPENNFLGPDLYNQIFTMHGTTMMFLFAVPIMEAMAVYLVPLMLGTRNIAFPRLNAYGYWVYLFGGLMIYVAFILNVGPDVGWFSYPPLAGPEYSPGKRADFWAQLITFTEVAALVVATELITTIFKLRAPGMSLNRIPLYVWSVLVMSFMVFFAMPTVALASLSLILDRLVGTHFFNPAEGGDPLLWQHLFWFFGHPEVYIIFIPATGFVSAIIPTFVRRPIFGYTALVLSLISTGFIGFGLWVHHMFAAGLPRLGESFFTAATMMIVIPSGVQIFCWIATIWAGRPVFKTPLLFVLGFFFTFVLGGLTGVMQASVPLDLQVHDTYFVVAHFHYVLIGGAVFPLFGAFYYWFPKFTGRMLSEAWGKLNFWLMFVGFNLTFFPQHLLGLQGMPRRVYTYQPGLGWSEMNLLASAGGVLLTLGVLVFIFNAVRSRRTGAHAGDNPWGASTLEWATTSPPPNYNFLYLPTVAGREALWTQSPEQPVVTGLRSDVRQVLVTKMLDAEPDHIEQFPQPTLWPFWAAVATTALFIGSIFTPWAVVWGAIPVGVTLTGWFWPKRRQAEERPPEEVTEKASGEQAAAGLREQTT